MPDQDFSPRAARKLRDFGRRRVDDGAPPNAPSTPAPREPVPSEPAGTGTPAAAPITPGSIWGPQLTTTEPEPEESEPEAEPEEPANPRHRRRAGERPPDPDSVDIASDDSHAWWAQRADLDKLVNPKKRGAAARAQRAAREAFAPAGATNVAANAYATDQAHSYSWNPADVYTWSSEGEPSVPEPPSVEREATPWDLLGLTSEATWGEVTKRHRSLAKEHHPDRHAEGGPAARAAAEQRMAEINAAFGDLRRIYRLTDGI